MPPSLWKRLLSHFIEIHIESAPSEHNPHLYVSLRQGRYQLCTEHAIYSFGDLYDNFSNAFHKIKLDDLAIREVLILGFGLGSIPIILEKMFAKSYHYTGVEIDEAVVYLAGKYALPEIKSPVQLFTTDAATFIMQCRQHFDLITMDIFLDDEIPAVFQGQPFLEKLKNLLKPGGLLMFNRLAHNEADISQSKAYFEQTFKKVFPHATWLDVKGNWMLLSHADVL